MALPQVVGQPVTAASINQLWRQGVQSGTAFPTTPTPTLNDHFIRTDWGWAEFAVDISGNWAQVCEGWAYGSFPASPQDAMRIYRRDLLRTYVYVAAYTAWVPVIGRAVMCRATNSATYTIASGVQTATGSPTWNTNAQDSGDSIHSTSSNQSRMTAPYYGLYRFSASIIWTLAAATTGYMQLGIHLNGSAAGSPLTQISYTPNTNAAFGSTAIAGEYLLVAGDYLECKIWNPTAQTATIATTSSFTMSHAMTF